MSGRKSKNKGKSYERDIAKFLSSLYGESFIKVPYSGAMVGGMNKHRSANLSAHQNQTFKGDISPPIEWTQFNCEAKSYAEFPFHQLFTGKIVYLETWLSQLLNVAEPNDFNILCMKFNRKGTYVAVEGKNQDKLKLSRKFHYTSDTYGEWIMMDFETFWNDNKDTVKELSTGQTLGKTQE